VTLIIHGGVMLNIKNGMKKTPPEIESPHKITEIPYNCIDTGGFLSLVLK